MSLRQCCLSYPFSSALNTPIYILTNYLQHVKCNKLNGKTKWKENKVFYWKELLQRHAADWDDDTTSNGNDSFSIYSILILEINRKCLNFFLHEKRLADDVHEQIDSN